MKYIKKGNKLVVSKDNGDVVGSVDTNNAYRVDMILERIFFNNSDFTVDFSTLTSITDGNGTVRLKNSFADFQAFFNYFSTEVFFLASGGGGGGSTGTFKFDWNPKTNTPNILTDTTFLVGDYAVVKGLNVGEKFTFNFGAKGGLIELTELDEVYWNGSVFKVDQAYLPDAYDVTFNNTSVGDELVRLDADKVAKITPPAQQTLALLNNENSSILADNVFYTRNSLGVDLNLYVKNGIFDLVPSNNPEYTNVPSGFTKQNGGNLIVFKAKAINAVQQILFQSVQNVFFIRNKNYITSVWSSWAVFDPLAFLTLGSNQLSNSSSAIQVLDNDLLPIQQDNHLISVSAYLLKKYITSGTLKILEPNKSYQQGDVVIDLGGGTLLLANASFDTSIDPYIEILNENFISYDQNVHFANLNNILPKNLIIENLSNGKTYKVQQAFVFQGVYDIPELLLLEFPRKIEKEEALPIGTIVDGNNNYNLANSFGVGSYIYVDAGNDAFHEFVYIEEDANGIPTWALKDEVVESSARLDLMGDYQEGTIITVNNAIGLPDANYSNTNTTSLFTKSFKANYIVDFNEPLFDIVDNNGLVLNSINLRYLSSAENPIKTDDDLVLSDKPLNFETQKELNNFLAQRGDVLSNRNQTSLNVGFNINDADIAITSSYTGLANEASVKIDVVFSGTLSDNSIFEFDLSNLGTCLNINGYAWYSDDSKARVFEGIVIPSTGNKFRLSSNGDYWRNGHPVTGVSNGDAIQLNIKCNVSEWNRTSTPYTKPLTAGANITIEELANERRINAIGGGTYADSQNYWVFKNVQDNAEAFIYNTLQKAHDAFVASGKSLGYIFVGAGQYTDPCTITATNLHIEGVGNGSRSQTQQNGKVTITGHRATFKNILFGNASATSPVEINCAGTLTENGVPNIGRGKPVFDNCTWSLANGVAPIAITALNNWATFSFCDFGGKGALTLPNNATPVSWYYLFASCSNVGLIRGSNTITAIDSNSVSVVDVSAQPTATAFRGNQLVTWVLGTPVFRGHFYYHNGVLYLAKNTVASSITAPNLDTTNFQNALYTTSPTTQYNVSDTLNAPPASPIDGETYLVGTSPTGAYVGKANNIAVYSTSTSTWSFIAPSTSIVVIFSAGANAGKIATWNGTAWVVSTAVSSDPFPVGFEYDGYLSPGVGWVDISINRVTLSKTTYATLWNLITANLKTTTDNASTIGMYIDLGASGFQTPKAGGTFKRPIQGAQNVGSYVADSIASHNHSYRLGGGFQDQLQGGNSRFFSPDYAYGAFYDYTTWNTGSTETAPKHTTTKRWLKVI